jgi:hypothetical protein
MESLRISRIALMIVGRIGSEISWVVATALLFIMGDAAEVAQREAHCVQTIERQERSLSLTFFCKNKHAVEDRG